MKDEELAPRLVAATNAVVVRLKTVITKLRESGPDFTDAERAEAHLLIRQMEEIAGYKQPD